MKRVFVCDDEEKVLLEYAKLGLERRKKVPKTTRKVYPSQGNCTVKLPEGFSVVTQENLKDDKS